MSPSQTSLHTFSFFHYYPFGWNSPVTGVGGKQETATQQGETKQSSLPVFLAREREEGEGKFSQNAARILWSLVYAEQ